MLNGASPQEAKAIELQTYALESGGTIEAVSQSSGKALHGSFAYDSDDGFWLSNGTDRVRLGWDASMTDVSDFLGNSAARDLGMQYASSRLVAKQAADAAFARGVARGEAMYAAGVRNREQIGVDFSGFNRNVDAYVRFREGQRAQFNDFYSGLNGVQRFAFNAGANLFGGLLNGGKAIGNLTAFTGIQGRQDFADSWGGLGNSVAGAASYAYNNPAGFAKSAIVDPITGAWDHYAGIYQADGFGAAAGTLTGDLLSGVPFALAGLSKPVHFPKADLTPLHRRIFAEDSLAALGFNQRRAANYLDGIDFNHPVELVELKVGAPYAQFQPMGRPMGNFLTDIGADINTLGIRPTGKLLAPYAPTQTIPALRSITSDIEVNWDGLPKYKAKGGGVQYIIPDQYKSMFEVLYYGD
ncbi:MAG TPA: hypothetical protein DF774_01365 [Rheinheimera sp.]|uniref:polymorphic toxin type 46 domain-containing protein n=1 Tax=Rheinheimera sp. TaxID=1869214 RepID=UPI000EC1A6AC|nr:polymorphic toxin type 46 domain-containing protein [Rheinheimera sp.]HCU64388.1 hypothetical protein [Rheinheimera sp.]